MLYRLVLCLVAAFAVAGTMPTAHAQAYNPCGFKADKIMDTIRNPKPDLTLLVAHRGLHALWGSTAYRYTPENSIEAIKNTMDRCFEIAEVDVRLSSDGVPVLSHDFNWGREVETLNIAPCAYPTHACYNPWNNTGPNPSVGGTSYNGTQSWKIRNSVGFETSSEQPMDLWGMIAYIKSMGSPLVLAIDVKDEAALREAWRAVAQSKFHRQAFFKINAALFPKPSVIYNIMKSTSWACQCGVTDDQYINVMPVFNTENIAPNNVFGSEPGEAKVKQHALWWRDYTVAPFVIGVEFNVKDYEGILNATIADFKNGSVKKTIANFSPYREYTGGGKNEYWDSSGKCCNELSKFYYNGSSWGGPSDTIDRRTQTDFMINYVLAGKLNMITTDNVDRYESLLSGMNARNTIKYFR